MFATKWFLCSIFDYTLWSLNCRQPPSRERSLLLLSASLPLCLLTTFRPLLLTIRSLHVIFTSDTKKARWLGVARWGKESKQGCLFIKSRLLWIRCNVKLNPKAADSSSFPTQVMLCNAAFDRNRATCSWGTRSWGESRGHQCFMIAFQRWKIGLIGGILTIGLCTALYLIQYCFLWMF